MMSSSANYRPFLRSFHHTRSGEFCHVGKLTILEENGRRQEKCLFGKNWAKIPQDICKDKESNLGPVAGY